MSGGHLCEAEAPTEAAAETVARRSRDGRREKLLTHKSYTFSLTQSAIRLTAPSSEGGIGVYPIKSLTQRSYAATGFSAAVMGLPTTI